MAVYLFPGQGCHVKGMGGELFNEFKELTQMASDILGYSIKELCLYDPQRLLELTQYTQPALFVVSTFTYLKKISKEKNKPKYVAGHSLGESCALFSAGVFDFETGLRIVQKRGEIMSKIKNGGMAVIIGPNEDETRQILQKNNLSSLDIANINSLKQIVISGPYEDILTAQSYFESTDSIYTPLELSGPFHSRYMKEARDEFYDFIEQFQFLPFEIPVISNVTASPYEFECTKKIFADQINHTVRWADTIKFLIDCGEDQFEEMGPGKVLSGLVRQIKKNLIGDYDG